MLLDDGGPVSMRLWFLMGCYRALVMLIVMAVMLVVPSLLISVHWPMGDSICVEDSGVDFENKLWPP